MTYLLHGNRGKNNLHCRPSWIQNLPGCLFAATSPKIPARLAHPELWTLLITKEPGYLLLAFNWLLAFYWLLGTWYLLFTGYLLLTKNCHRTSFFKLGRPSITDFVHITVNYKFTFKQFALSAILNSKPPRLSLRHNPELWTLLITKQPGYEAGINTDQWLVVKTYILVLNSTACSNPCWQVVTC
jgi:hypothetical protein